MKIVGVDKRMIRLAWCASYPVNWNQGGVYRFPEPLTTTNSSFDAISSGPPRSGTMRQLFPLIAAATTKEPAALSRRLATRAPGLIASPGNCTTSGKCCSNTSPNLFRALRSLTSPAIWLRRPGSAMSLIKSSSRAIAGVASWTGIASRMGKNHGFCVTAMCGCQAVYFHG